MPYRDATRDLYKYSRYCNQDAWYWGYKTCSQGKNYKLTSLTTVLSIRPIMNMCKAKACNFSLFTPQ